nr:MAG TPA: hypothetical protein [Caudoviricetes sp.]
MSIYSFFFELVNKIAKFRVYLVKKTFLQSPFYSCFRAA